MIIRINREFRPDLGADRLYHVTRSSWVVGERRECAEYALSVYQGKVLEVYAISSWRMAANGRWEFRGRPADEDVRRRYVGTSVKHYLKPGNQNPIVYVNC
jgi:hypothetical protein